MAGSIVVRPATGDEAADLRRVIETAFVTVRDVYRPLQHSLATSDRPELDCRGIVALCDAVPVGVAYVYSEQDTLHVTQLAVLPEYRRRGVARHILRYAEQMALDSGLPELRLNTVQETGNVNIFERLGFHVVASSIATWCVSDRYSVLNDVQMLRSCRLQ